MSARAQAALLDAFPGMRIVVVFARGLDNTTPMPAVESYWREAWADAAIAGAAFANAQSHPRVAAWRDAFKAIGVSGKNFPASIEALLRRAMKGGEPFSINPLVDFYNAVSLRHVVPAGAFDGDALPAELEVRFTREGDRFQALDDDAPLVLPAGESAYACGATVLSRHLAWRQSREALVTPRTRRVVLVSEILGPLDDAVADAVERDLMDGLHRFFGVQAHAARIDRACPVATPADIG